MSYAYNFVRDVRDHFADRLKSAVFTTDKTGAKLLEIIGACFVADEESIFGTVNKNYVERELEWYHTQSLSVDDFPGGAPTIWKQVAGRDGKITSNYGNLVLSERNGSQYEHVLRELRDRPDSRRAVMIYTNPQMWEEYCREGRSDFCCTHAVQYFVREGELAACVQMRSNDVVFGYLNDRAWQLHVLDLLSEELSVPKYQQPLLWNAGSLHVYERHFYLVDNYIKTGQHYVSKKDYDERYPDSEWATK